MLNGIIFSTQITSKKISVIDLLTYILESMICTRRDHFSVSLHS